MRTVFLTLACDLFTVLSQCWSPLSPVHDVGPRVSVESVFKFFTIIRILRTNSNTTANFRVIFWLPKRAIKSIRS